VFPRKEASANQGGKVEYKKKEEKKNKAFAVKIEHLSLRNADTTALIYKICKISGFQVIMLYTVRV